MSGERQIPNIEYLGGTFDIVTMDPFDLGSTAKLRNVFDWSVTSGESSVGQYVVPKGVNFRAPNKTDHVSESRTVSSSYDMQTTAKTIVEADVGVPGVFEFSASRGVTEMESSTRTRKWTYSFARAYRERYIVGVDLLAAHPGCTLTHSFRNEVAELPTSFENDGADHYERFIEEFGTHLTWQMCLGGFAEQRTKGLASRYLRTTESEDTFTAKASAVIKAVSGGASVETAEKTVTTADQSDELERSQVLFIGGTGSVSGITDAWLQSLDEEPAIVKASLARLSTILDKRFFPEDAAIDEKATYLSLAIDFWIRKRGKAGSVTAPLRFGEELVIVLPLEDGTVLYPWNDSGTLSYPLTRESTGNATSAAVVLEPHDRKQAGSAVLSGDTFRMKLAGTKSYAGPTFVLGADTANIFYICHENENLYNPSGEYFDESDKVQIVVTTPPGTDRESLSIATGWRGLNIIRTDQPTTKFRLVRKDWLS